MINFASASASPANSFMSSLIDETESSTRCPRVSRLQIFLRSRLSADHLFPRRLLRESRIRWMNLLSSALDYSSSGRCRCHKKQKSKKKKVVRVPAISMKMSAIPPNDYSWIKYGQKQIKGFLHPRVLQVQQIKRFSGGPARKHVERELDDPTMLIVTYEGEHSHSQSLAESPAALNLHIP